MFKSIPKIFTLALAFIIGTAVFSACSDDSSDPSTELNIAETVQTESNLSSLQEQLSGKDLTDTLSQEGPFTLFAPSNEALEEAALDTMTEEEIKTTIQYHIVESNLTYENLKDQESVETLNGDSLYFETDSDTVMINGDQAEITSNGMEATNGNVFVVDTLLSAPDAHASK